MQPDRTPNWKHGSAAGQRDLQSRHRRAALENSESAQRRSGSGSVTRRSLCSDCRRAMDLFNIPSIRPETCPRNSLAAKPLLQRPRTHARKPGARRAQYPLALSAMWGGACSCLAPAAEGGGVGLAPPSGGRCTAPQPAIELTAPRIRCCRPPRPVARLAGTRPPSIQA